MQFIKKFFTNFSFDKYDKYAIINCLLFFMILIILSSFHEIGGFGVETDFYGAYADNAQKILNGERYYDEDHGPGYLFILIVFYLVTGDFFIAGKFVSIFSATLLGLFTFLTIKALFNSKLAFFTTLLLLIIIFPISLLASTDMFFSFLFSLAIYFLFRKGEISVSNLFWGGLISGYSIMTRLNSIVLPLVIIFSIIFLNPPKWHFPKILKSLLIFLVAILITLSPWLIMNIIYYGKPFVSGAHQTIGASFLKQEAPIGDTDFAWTAMKLTVSEKYDSIFSLILGNFQSFIIFFLKNIIPYFQKILLELIKFPGYLFFAPGVVLLLSKINKIQLTYFLIPVLGFLIYCIVSFDLRFYIYIAVFLLFFVVYFLFYENFSHNNISFKSRFNLISKIFFIITIFFLSKESFNEMKANITAEPLYLLKIADTLKHDAQNSDIIFARKPHLGYFSHIKTELLPDLDSAELLLQYAKAKGVKYLFYGITEAKARPKLNMLQEPEKLPAAFQLIYAQDFPKAFLYKLALEK